MKADPVHFERPSDVAKAALLASAFAVVYFWLQGDILVNLADEGFLWYGTVRTALGEVPLRDFQSYDPGRYFWSAAWSEVFGNGIIGLRKSVAIFQIVGITAGLLALRRAIRSWLMLAVAGVLLVIWMEPNYKIFDHCLALTGVYFAVILIEKPSPGRLFAAGVFIGAAAIFGRNHGLYGFVSFLFIILIIWGRIDRTHPARRIMIWGAGIAVGYSPMLIISILAPGFFESFVKSILFHFKVRSTNFFLPIPWPWRVDFGQKSIMDIAQGISTGTLFFIIPVFYVSAGAYLLRCSRDDLKRKALLVASVFTGALYMHYAFSRADLAHLALGIPPFLIGALSLPFLFKGKIKKTIAGIFLGCVFIMSFFSAVTASPWYVKANSPGGVFVKEDIHGEELWVYRYIARSIRCVTEINRQKVPPDEGFLLIPHWPGVYPVLERRSPLWDIYLLFRETEKRQNQMIKELKEKNVNWVILGDIALDGRNDFRFRNTHALVWRHLMDEFENIESDCLPRNYQLLRRK
ncbi:MAG TPA: hypothetical protein PK874_06040 [Desulfobacteraceae bacterium]|nr:hypothetical protein [Desulfobacteraceae bacterium]HPJ68836.1 hypothetical protein [Desulfobacteraceae bacterium]HPQ27431.1 hypothetical protein [Desulfobacteraceae bacterium]